MSFLATTSGVSGEDVRDLMLAAVEHRFGLVNRLPVTIEWLSDNGSCDVHLGQSAEAPLQKFCPEPPRYFLRHGQLTPANLGSR